VTLARCADRTSTIGLGPGVLIPSLRHPMTNAAAIATLVELAGRDRVAVAVGTGFTGRFTLGQKPLRWAFVADYVRALRGLLRGEVVTWEGAKMQMIHPEGFGAARPIDVPILLGAAGPKGVATAKEVGDGVFLAGVPPTADFAHAACLLSGRSSTTTTISAPSGCWPPPATARRSPTTSGSRPVGRWNELPRGNDWVAAYADVPADERHPRHPRRTPHRRETSADRAFVTPEVLQAMGAAFRPAELRERLAAMADAGMTEIAYQPAGPDIPPGARGVSPRPCAADAVRRS